MILYILIKFFWGSVLVLYFSATGNTEFVAKTIAKGLDDDCVNLLTKIKANDFSDICSEKPFVVCSPVYVCELPRFFAKFIKKVKFIGNKNVYFVFTSGGYAGISGSQAKRIFRRKKMKVLGHAEITMPRNYIASNMYSELPENEICKRITAAANKIPDVIAAISKGEKLTARHVYLFEHLIILPFTPIWTKLKQPSKPFFATEKCIGCGKCVKLCPLNNIKLENGKPVWIKSCAHCMACIQNCPALAIEYGKITQTKTRYCFDKYKNKALQSENLPCGKNKENNNINND